MDRSNKLLCPKCGTALKSARGVRIGRTIKCPKCEADFTVRPEDAKRAGVNTGRLLFVLGAALLYLGGGAGLAYYCFALNSPKHDAAQIQASEPNGSADDGDEPSPPPQPAQLPTVAPVSSEQQRKIDNAIAKGAWYLKDHMLTTGTWADALPDGARRVSVGCASLPGLTLLECGVPATDPAVQKAAALVRRRVETLGTVHQNYQRSLAILFLDRLGDSRDESLIEHVALCLIAAQHPSVGGWSYSGPPVDRTKTSEYLRALRHGGQSLDDWRKAAQKGGTFSPKGWDNSNTQFAILALWVARRHQVPIEKSMAQVEKHFRTTQLPSGPDPTGNNLNLDGSWNYNATNNSSRWPSMTCAGLLGLAISHGMTVSVGEEKQVPVNDPAIQRGLAMLGREIDRPDEKRPPDLYFLWSLERVGVLYNLPKIGGKDWYAWGCKVLLPMQDADGSWKNGAFVNNSPVLNTCFALLFLKQANLAQDLTNKLNLLEKK